MPAPTTAPEWAVTTAKAVLNYIDRIMDRHIPRDALDAGRGRMPPVVFPVAQIIAANAPAVDSRPSMTEAVTAALPPKVEPAASPAPVAPVVVEEQRAAEAAVTPPEVTPAVEPVQESDPSELAPPSLANINDALAIKPLRLNALAAALQSTPEAVRTVIKADGSGLEVVAGGWVKPVS